MKDFPEFVKAFDLAGDTPDWQMQIILDTLEGKIVREHTMNDPDPVSFLPSTWLEAVPKGAWYTQTGGESVAAAHANAQTSAIYRQHYLDLKNRDFSHEWIKQIFQIAFDFKMEPGEVADLIRANPRINDPHAEYIELRVEKPTPNLFPWQRFQEISRMNRKLRREIEIKAHEPHMEKEKFKDKLQKQILESRRLRTKKENKKRRRR